MFLHEFGEDFVLALELLFQGGDPAILVIAGTSGPGLERGGGVLEEFLLPAIEHGGVDAVPITEVGDGGVFQEKAAILRLHLLEHTPVSDLCDRYGIHPTMFYLWQKEVFPRCV